jgi:YbbR domain-containing protein
VADVILEGPDTILSQMQPDDLKVIVDVLGYSSGVYPVQPEVLAPDGVGVVSIIPGTIEVSILPTPVITPTVSPSSSP